MYNTQYPLLLSQHNGNDAPQDYPRTKLPKSQILCTLARNKCNNDMIRFHVKVVHFHYHILNAYKFRIGYDIFILACIIKRLHTKSVQFFFRYKSGPLPRCLDLSSDDKIGALHLEGRKFT